MNERLEIASRLLAAHFTDPEASIVRTLQDSKSLHNVVNASLMMADRLIETELTSRQDGAKALSLIVSTGH